MEMFYCHVPHFRGWKIKSVFLQTCLLEHCIGSVTRLDFTVEDEMYLCNRALPDFGVRKHKRESGLRL